MDLLSCNAGDYKVDAMKWIYSIEREGMEALPYNKQTILSKSSDYEVDAT